MGEKLTVATPTRLDGRHFDPSRAARYFGGYDGPDADSFTPSDPSGNRYRVSLRFPCESPMASSSRA